MEGRPGLGRAAGEALNSQPGGEPRKKRPQQGRAAGSQGPGHRGLHRRTNERKSEQMKPYKFRVMEREERDARGLGLSSERSIPRRRCPTSYYFSESQ